MLRKDGSARACGPRFRSLYFRGFKNGLKMALPAIGPAFHPDC
jgi:hypothetical protein